MKKESLCSAAHLNALSEKLKSSSRVRLISLETFERISSRVGLNISVERIICGVF